MPTSTRWSPSRDTAGRPFSSMRTRMRSDATAAGRALVSGHTHPEGAPPFGGIRTCAKVGVVPTKPRKRNQQAAAFGIKRFEREWSTWAFPVAVTVPLGDAIDALTLAYGTSILAW